MADGSVGRWMNLLISDDQYKNMKAAMETAQVLLGSTKKGHPLDMICLEFNTSHQREGESREDAIARFCAGMMRAFDVTLIVIDPKTKDVLHGENELKSLE
jgi:hypothetical protein